MTRWLRCRDCKRPLRSEEAQKLGFGSDCARKRGLTPPKRRRTQAVRRPKPVAVPPAPGALPGQDELPLFFHQPTLGSV